MIKIMGLCYFFPTCSVVKHVKKRRTIFHKQNIFHLKYNIFYQIETMESFVYSMRIKIHVLGSVFSLCILVFDVQKFCILGKNIMDWWGCINLYEKIRKQSFVIQSLRYITANTAKQNVSFLSPYFSVI